VAIITEGEISKLSEVVGEFYRGAGTSNGFQAVLPGGIGDGISPTHWHRADYVDPETAISSEITEWRDELAVNDYLGSISIRQSGLFVYNAVVNRHNTSDHANRQFSMKRGWLDALVEVNSRYQESSRP
jgi:hypothetical protein